MGKKLTDFLANLEWRWSLCSAPLKLSQILLEFWHLFGRDWDGSEALFGRGYIEFTASD